MIYNIVMRFDEWITAKYVEWRGNAIGRERTITDFAEYIGVSQSLMSQWMTPNGKIPRSFTTISKLVARFGDEVDDVLGQTPQPMEKIFRLVAQTNPAAYTDVIKAIEEIKREYDLLEISSDEEENNE